MPRPGARCEIATPEFALPGRESRRRQVVPLYISREALERHSPSRRFDGAVEQPMRGSAGRNSPGLAVDPASRGNSRYRV